MINKSGNSIADDAAIQARFNEEDNSDDWLDDEQEEPSFYACCGCGIDSDFKRKCPVCNNEMGPEFL